jgi:hypothetical protein
LLRSYSFVGHNLGDQVQHDLLKLDPITLNYRQILRQLGLQLNAVLRHFTAGQPNDFRNHFVWWSLEVLDRLTPDNEVPAAVVGRAS